MPKLTASELLHRACILAEMSLACDENDVAFEEELDLLAQLRAYRIKRWGKSKIDSLQDGIERVPMNEFFPKELVDG